jgi:PAS domain S-box-containing protein
MKDDDSNKNIIAYETYVAFLEYAKIPMIIIDDDMTIVLCNKAFELLSGYSRDDVEGKLNWNILIGDPSHLDMMKDYHRIRRDDPSSAPEEYEFIFKTKCGELKDIALTITMIQGTKRSITFLQDITEKKKSDLWYRTVFENTGLPSIIIDVDTRIVKANAEWFSHSGYSQADIDTGMSWTAYVHEDDVDRILLYHKKRREDPASVPRRYELRIRRKNMEIRYAIATVGMIPGSVYSIASMMDITELKESEKERAKLEDQLHQSRKLESIGQLAGGIAHDFNNMLAAIMGYSQLAQIRLRNFLDFFSREKTNIMLSLDEFFHEYINGRKAKYDIEGAFSDMIGLMSYGIRMIESQMHNVISADDMIEDSVKASQKAGALTRQLLAFARKQTLEVKPVNLNDLIREFSGMLRRTIRENIEIEIRFADDLGIIEADAGQIEQILLNLAVNAQDAMPAGGQLVISTGNAILDAAYANERPGIIPGEYIMLLVCDTGSGMDKKTQERIFEPFFTTKEQGKGTGLGLATVYGIVKQHRGNIWVYSEPGKGTSFRIYLPRSDKSPEAMDDYSSVASSSGTETILIVEDQDQVRKMTTMVLREQGYNVLEAENSYTALETATLYEGNIDLLVSDVVLPGINGRELFDVLKRFRPGLKSLFVSGYPMEIISHHGILDHGFNLISKPVPIAAFIQKVREILDK